MTGVGGGGYVVQMVSTIYGISSLVVLVLFNLYILAFLR